ncbi:hypothetical protein Hanom_Chr02g00164451 [Helianthus anomalus]
MSEPRAPNCHVASPPVPATVSGAGGGQILHPIRRQFPFSSMKPPFVPAGDCYRFSSEIDGGVARATAENVEVIVVKSPVV